MIRALVYFGLVAVAIAIAYLLVIVAPGEVSVQWLGWQLRTSIAVAILALLFVCALTAVGYYGWRLLRRAPKDFWNQQGQERRNRGYRALSAGQRKLTSCWTTNPCRVCSRRRPLSCQAKPRLLVRTSRRCSRPKRPGSWVYVAC